MKLKIKYDKYLITIPLNDIKTLSVQKILEDIRIALKIKDLAIIKLMTSQGEHIPSNKTLLEEDILKYTKEELYLIVLKYGNCDSKAKQLPYKGKKKNNVARKKTMDKLLAEIINVTNYKDIIKEEERIDNNQPSYINLIRLFELDGHNEERHMIGNHRRRYGFSIEITNNNFNNNHENQQRLIEMGFPEDRIRIALNLGYGNLQTATHILLNPNDNVFENHEIYLPSNDDNNYDEEDEDPFN